MDEGTKVPAEQKTEATPVSDDEQADAAKKEQLPADRVKLPQKLWSRDAVGRAELSRSTIQSPRQRAGTTIQP